MRMAKSVTLKTVTYPLNLTEGLREAAGEICTWVPELARIDVSRVQFSLFYARQAKRTLTYARCYPLSREVRQIGRRWYALEPIYTPQRRKARYIVAFAWKRYWNLSPRKRLETLVHELYHISPRFDGELRSFETGGFHGHGLRWFDRQVRELMETYIPDGLEQEFPALTISLNSGLKVTGEKLYVPQWQRIVDEQIA